MSSSSSHEHKGQRCPVSGRVQDHKFCPAQEGDSRSVCPALNAMANHGYISRDGKNLTAQELTRGVKECYGISTPLAYLLGYGGFALLGKFGFWQKASLREFGKHNVIEHNASLVHHDISDKDDDYAPIEVDKTLLEALCGDIKSPKSQSNADEKSQSSESQAEERLLMDFEDLARARLRREKEAGHIDSFHKEVARGEMAMMLGVWSIETDTKTGIPFEHLRNWLGDERLPDGWKPTHTQGLLNLLKRSNKMRAAVKKVKQEEKTQ